MVREHKRAHVMMVGELLLDADWVMKKERSCTDCMNVKDGVEFDKN